MPTSDAAGRGLSIWDVVRVDLPYADEPSVRRHRPALVIAVVPVDEDPAILWLLMITSARHSAWPHDAPVTVLAGTGLSHPCIVRVAKAAVLESRFAARIGSLGDADRACVRHGLAAVLAPALERTQS